MAKPSFLSGENFLMKSISKTAHRLRRHALAAAVVMTIAGGAAHAQSNITGAIFGQVPAGSTAATVVIENTDTGFTRSAPADSAGRYRFSSLPTGTYKVTLQDNGKTVTSRENVSVQIAGGTEVSFNGATSAQNLEGVSVMASALPTIDVSSVDTRTVLTSEQLNKLPLSRDIAAAALLAPGVIPNGAYNAPSFGGSASSENAYFINGYAVTNPLTSIGSTQLPFDAIDSEQVLTGGYGAEFGRSTGGVINITTKRGTNEWHAGIYNIWQPASTTANPKNNYFPNTGFYGANSVQKTDGTLYWYRNENKSWRNTTGIYASGPIIKDKLFFYANTEMTKRQGASVASFSNSSASVRNQGYNEYTYHIPRWTAKIDWNITDSNILELTGVSDKSEYESSRYSFNYADDTHGQTKTGGTYTKDGGDLYVGKYTGYVTDDLTVSVLYGQQRIKHIQTPFGYNPACPLTVSSAITQVPGVAYGSCQPVTSALLLQGANDRTHGGRLDIEYRIGDHDIRVGYDKQTAQSLSGSQLPGGYRWTYAFSANPNAPVDAGHGVIGSPAGAGGYGTRGYYVSRDYVTTAAAIETKQDAQFIEDRWQVADRWLLSLGLRNEQFTNYNSNGDKYISQRHQLAPRLGTSWDVYGDSTLKIYANAGRYHLAVPNNVALRAASGSLNTTEYFTYSGVDANGAPTGLTPIAINPGNAYVCPGGNANSTNIECGDAPDPRTVAAKGIKSHFQDEYILGMEQQISTAWTYGAKLTYRKLRSAIDDTCTPVLGGRCFLFNPGTGNTFQIENDDGSFSSVHYSKDDLQLPDLKRKYYALDLFLEHPLADGWYGRIAYTFSRNYGNTEGQLASDLDTGAGGQADVSVTQDWDLPELMEGANGLLPNNRKHQLKAFGYWQISDDFRVGSNISIASGRPKNCTSYYPEARAGLYNSSTYYYCGLPGTAAYAYSPRGSHGTTPWVYTLDLSAAYTPSWLDKHLTFQLDVFNVLNRQVATGYNYRSVTNRTTFNQLYGRELNVTDPRSLRFTARYDF